MIIGPEAEAAVAQFRADTADELKRLAAGASGQDAVILLEYSKHVGSGYLSAASDISKATGIRPQRIITAVLSRYSPIAMSRAKLRQYRRNGLTVYDISTAADACACCKEAAARGPYRVDNPTAIPGLLGCDHCRCAIMPHVAD